jgi:hypothetical protein
MHYPRLLLILLLFIAFQANAQKVMLEEKPDVAANTRFGPNLDYFMQFTFSYGMLVGKGDDRLPINNWRSSDFTAGLKLKRKINGLLSVWLEPKYHYAAYNIRQTDSINIADKMFETGNKIKHVKERFATESILLNGFLRVNFDPKRGNYLGNYLDLGAGVDFMLGKEYLSLDKVSGGPTDGSIKRTSYTGLPFMNDIGYNTFARLGFNWIAIGFNYRMSSLFKSQYGYPEPPAYTVFIDINPYSH